MADDAEKQIDELRRRLQGLAVPGVNSAMAVAAYRTWTASRQTSAAVRGKTAVLRDIIHRKPLASVLVAAAAGFLISRLRA